VEETPAHPAEERFFVGLRLLEGIRPTGAERAQYGARIAQLVDAGLLEDAEGRIRLTRRGVLLSNEVFQEFIGSEWPAN
jgi:oxygen-independent coproporphyrinogen-3 oxidase